MTEGPSLDFICEEGLFFGKAFLANAIFSGN